LGVPFVAARHENQAVGMADAYGRVSGKLAVVILTSGPGFTNALTYLTTAARARTPLLVIVGANLAREDEPEFEIYRGPKYFRYGAVCETEGIPFVKPTDAATALDEVRQAIVDAESGRTVVLNLANDILAAEA